MPRWENEAFYEVTVEVEETRKGTVSVWVRAPDEATARTLAVAHVSEACGDGEVGDNAFDDDFDGSDVLCTGVEHCKHVTEGQEPAYEAPHFDLLDDPTTDVAQDLGPRLPLD